MVGMVGVADRPRGVGTGRTLIRWDRKTSADHSSGVTTRSVGRVGVPEASATATICSSIDVRKERFAGSPVPHVASTGHRPVPPKLASSARRLAT